MCPGEENGRQHDAHLLQLVLLVHQYWRVPLIGRARLCAAEYQLPVGLFRAQCLLGTRPGRLCYRFVQFHYALYLAIIC